MRGLPEFKFSEFKFPDILHKLFELKGMAFAKIFFGVRRRKASGEGRQPKLSGNSPAEGWAQEDRPVRFVRFSFSFALAGMRNGAGLRRGGFPDLKMIPQNGETKRGQECLHSFFRRGLASPGPKNTWTRKPLPLLTLSFHSVASSNNSSATKNWRQLQFTPKSQSNN